MKDAIVGLEPQLLWQHFYMISQIPRCSKDEERVRQYVLDVAERNGLATKMDDVKSVVVEKPATPGLEDAPIVILQSHLDMVCDKNRDTVHDFNKDAIKLLRNENWLTADGTTLGADNGIGVAASLAVMESSNIKHGPLEILFTIDEETGLTGATQLGEDMLEGRILINMDSEEDGIFYIGCAGGKDTELFFNHTSEAVPDGFTPVRIRLGGLQGGHSGGQIHEGLGNAIKLLGRYLLHVAPQTGLRMSDINGGGKHNVIPRECDAVCFVATDQLTSLQKTAEAWSETYRQELKLTDADVFLRVDESGFGTPNTVLSEDLQNRLLNFLQSMPHGVMGMSYAVPGLVETSTNLAVIRTSADNISILTSQRSSIESALINIANVVSSVGILAGADVHQGNGYPGWQPNPESQMLGLGKQVYSELFGDVPEVTAIHAGLECGIIGHKFPGMDMLSFGPTILGAHSPDERVNIPAVEKFWNFLARFIERLSQL